MKLIFCPSCKDIVRLEYIVKHCSCRLCAGKYLKDHITAVVNNRSLVFGIDNNSFNAAINNMIAGRQLYPSRVDFFFVGWFPTIPGEVIVIDNIDEIEYYTADIHETKSTMPVSIE